jgi:nicotinamidase-related amidase
MIEVNTFYDSLKGIYWPYPEHTAIFSVDMINGFCKGGPLASDRVAAIIPEVVDIVKTGYNLGVRDLCLIQDHHDNDAKEFESFPSHAVVGSEESYTIIELLEVMEGISYPSKILKNTINPSIDTGFDRVLDRFVEEGMNTAICVGNCTDLCVYQSAMHIKMYVGGVLGKSVRVIVPEVAVATYDLPGVHDGDYFHKTFLYHMNLNGIEVVKRIKG